MTIALLMRRLLPALLYACLCGGAWAQPQPMSDEELSHTSGQGLIAMSNSSLNGFDFTRISLDADITLSANFGNMRLGEYNYAPRNGTGADIDMPALQFGRSDGTDANRLVHISNPYFEFVYQNAADGASRQVIGMRLGFDAISGDVGLKINSLSGSMLVNGTDASGNPIALDSHTDTSGGGKRWDGSCTAPCLPMAQLGGVTAGDASGPSRDFWISVLKTGVQFSASGSGVVPDQAQAGVWLNWRDKLTALSATLPPNLPKGH